MKRNEPHNFLIRDQMRLTKQEKNNKLLMLDEHMSNSRR
jgi:hypothetical protein